MFRGSLGRAARRGAHLVLACAVGFTPATAVTRQAAADSGHRSVMRIDASAVPASRNVTIGLNKSLMIELPVPLGDVIVSNPEQVDAIVQSASRAYLIGKKAGEANAFFFDKNGQQILTLEVRVERDLSQIADMMDRMIPGANIHVEAVNDNLVLTGTVHNAVDSNRASEIAARFAKGPENVLNMIVAESREQVLLKVQIVEMNRNVAKQLGVNWNGRISIGPRALAFGSNPGFGVGAALLDVLSPDNEGVLRQNFGTNGAAGLFGSGENVVNLQALEQNGLLRTLAEPTLVAISGEAANFLAGGEFPVITGVDRDTNAATVEFKKFGVGLAFTPVVMSEGRISMKINAEVSELSGEGAIVTSGITIPGLKVRNAESTVELPSGGSLVMAGLISEDSKQALNGIPGLKNIPILGALFRSRDFIKKETELVVIVTPFIVDPVARAKLARPDENFLLPNDVGGYVGGRFNKITKPAALPIDEGSVKDGYGGFIIE